MSDDRTRIRLWASLFGTAGPCTLMYTRAIERIHQGAANHTTKEKHPVLTTGEMIRREVWADRLVLANLNHHQGGDEAVAAEGVEHVFAEITTREELQGVADVLASMLAEELAIRQPVNAARNVADSIAAKVDFLG